jgi:hypothetical protein
MRLVLAAVLLVGGCRATEDVHANARKTMTSDLNVVQLLGGLGPRYAKDGERALVPKDDAIRVLTRFRDADELALPSGEELWFGRSYDVHADANSFEGYVFCRLKRKGGDVVGFASGLVVNGIDEDSAADSLLSAIQTGKNIGANNRAYQYMKTVEPDLGWAPLVRSDGKSTVLTARSPRWLRQKDGQLLMVERIPHQPNEFFSAGRYAELWRAP